MHAVGMQKTRHPGTKTALPKKKTKSSDKKLQPGNWQIWKDRDSGGGISASPPRYVQWHRRRWVPNGLEKSHALCLARHAVKSPMFEIGCCSITFKGKNYCLNLKVCKKWRASKQKRWAQKCPLSQRATAQYFQNRKKKMNPTHRLQCNGSCEYSNSPCKLNGTWQASAPAVCVRKAIKISLVEEKTQYHECGQVHHRINHV